MMDTVLNLGMNEHIVKGVADKYGDRFAYDCYRRLLDMYADVVLGAPHQAFEEAIAALKVSLLRVCS
jgi:pyruvate, orthophosphate dikinase